MVEKTPVEKNEPLLIVGNVKKPSLEIISATEPGSIIFDANFECGNLGRVDMLSKNEYDLFIRPDTCNPTYRVWFYFSTQNAKANQRVVFNIVNFSKIRTLFDSGSAAPVFCTSTDKIWNRIPSKHIYYYRSQSHGDRFILSFVHVFAARNDYCEFAYCIPYSYTKLQNFLIDIERRKLPYFKRKQLTLSLQKRRVDLLTIGDPLKKNSSMDTYRQIFLTARVHPGETPSSIVLEGLIEFLISNHKKAEKLRSNYVFKIVPMLNPDGVYLGNYRCSLMGFDLNRQWQSPSAWAHPTIAATKNLLIKYNNNPHIDLCICIDLHAHSQQTNSFLYGNLVPRESRLCERQLYIPYLMAQNADDYSLQYTQFNTDAEKAGTNRRTMGEILNTQCLCYTMEVSFFSYKPNDNFSARAVPYFEEKYKLLGENLALAILGYLEILHEDRLIDVKRSFETFLSKRCVKTFKQLSNKNETKTRSASQVTQRVTTSFFK